MLYSSYTREELSKTYSPKSITLLSYTQEVIETFKIYLFTNWTQYLIALGVSNREYTYIYIHCYLLTFFYFKCYLFWYLFVY